MKLFFTIAVSLLMAAAIFGQDVDNQIYSPEATFVVTSSGDSNDLTAFDNLCLDAGGGCTLRAAIQQANALAGNDTITFSLNSPATINLTLGELYISQGVTISGTGARNLTVRRDSSAAAARVFNILAPSGSTINISGLTVANGYLTGTNFGAGLQITVGNTVNLSEVTIKDNSADVGGGIFNYGLLNIMNSTVSNNSATSEGGGIDNQTSGTINIANTTISNNTATNFGGGIIAYNTVTLNNVTIANNYARIYGGGIFNENAKVSLRNTIVANNTVLSSGPNLYGLTYSSLGNNLIAVSSGSLGFTNGTNGDRVGSSSSPINAMLGVLHNNGGATDTHLPQSSSPAIDAGNDCVTSGCATYNPPVLLSNDQRGSGFARRTDGNSDGTTKIDMGAVEIPAAVVTCSYTLGSNSQPFSAAGGSGSVTVTTTSNCSWSAQSNNSWISVTSGSGIGSGNVQFSVQSNTGVTRTGTMTIAGQTFTVNQSAPAPTFEGDVAVRPVGDGLILSDDIVQVQRFQIGLDQMNPSGEFQRADSAPFASRGNGSIQSDDVVQAQRYQIGLDAKQTAGGPLTAGAMVYAEHSVKAGKTNFFNAAAGAPREVRVESQTASAGQTIVVNIRADTIGDQSAYGFQLNFDQTKLTYVSQMVGIFGSSRLCNTTVAGQITCSVNNFPANQTGSSTTDIGEIPAGNNQLLLKITFTVAGNAAPGMIPLTLSNVNASNDSAQALTPITVTSGAVTVAAPTAAQVSVSGRVLTAQGRGIRNARVSLTDSFGNIRITTSSSFGYYRFENISAGGTYIFTVNGKRFTFTQNSQVHSIMEETNDINFIADDTPPN